MCKLETEQRELKESEFLSLKLATLKDAKIKLDERLKSLDVNPTSESAIESSGPATPEMWERQSMYRDEIRQVRQERDEAERVEYQTKEFIIQAWNRLKAVRAAQGYANTTHALIVFSKSSDKAADIATLEQELEDEITELRDDYEKELEPRRRSCYLYSTLTGT